MSTLIAARQALAEQQIRTLRDWLGEDHELVARDARAAQPALVTPRARPTTRPPIHSEVSA